MRGLMVMVVLFAVCAVCSGNDADPVMTPEDYGQPLQRGENFVQNLPVEPTERPKPSQCLPPPPDDPQEKYAYFLALKIKLGVRKHEGDKPKYTYKISTREIIDDEDEDEESTAVGSDDNLENVTDHAKKHVSDKIPEWIYKNRVEPPDNGDEVSNNVDDKDLEPAEIDPGDPTGANVEDLGQDDDLIDREST